MIKYLLLLTAFTYSNNFLFATSKTNPFKNSEVQSLIKSIETNREMTCSNEKKSLIKEFTKNNFEIIVTCSSYNENGEPVPHHVQITMKVFNTENKYELTSVNFQYPE